MGWANHRHQRKTGAPNNWKTIKNRKWGFPTNDGLKLLDQADTPSKLAIAEENPIAFSVVFAGNISVFIQILYFFLQLIIIGGNPQGEII